MKPKTMINILLTLFVVLVWLFSSLQIEQAQVHNLQIDISRPRQIVWPCEISIVGDLGEKGLRIGANIGCGWRGEATGHAAYRFYIPAHGNYTLWAYAKWFDECANAVFVQLDDSDKAILGNDPVYGQWHWVRGFSVDLMRGTHNLTLSNHSDHIAIEKLFLSNASRATPDASKNIFSDIFYDGFDGCDQGNFNQWKILSGKWQVRNPFQEMDFNQNILESDPVSNATIIYPDSSWSNYSLQVSVYHPDQPENKISSGIGFGWQDQTNYYQLLWQQPSPDHSINFQLLQKKNNTITILREFQFLWPLDTWHDITIALQSNRLCIAIDQHQPLDILLTEPAIGGIALFSQKKSTTYFDNIHVRQSH